MAQTAPSVPVEAHRRSIDEIRSIALNKGPTPDWMDGLTHLSEQDHLVMAFRLQQMYLARMGLTQEELRAEVAAGHALPYMSQERGWQDSDEAWMDLRLGRLFAYWIESNRGRRMSVRLLVPIAVAFDLVAKENPESELTSILESHRTEQLGREAVLASKPSDPDHPAFRLTKVRR